MKNIPQYSVQYRCANCGWSGSVKFDKGRRAPDTTTCPTCLVSGAKKSLPYVRRETVPRYPIIPTPTIPRDVHPWLRELPPYDPWDVPLKLYRPWDEPQRPYLEDIGNDIDCSITQWDDFDDGPDLGTGFWFRQ